MNANKRHFRDEVSRRKRLKSLTKEESERKMFVKESKLQEELCLTKTINRTLIQMVRFAADRLKITDDFVTKLFHDQGQVDLKFIKNFVKTTNKEMAKYLDDFLLLTSIGSSESRVDVLSLNPNVVKKFVGGRISGDEIEKLKKEEDKLEQQQQHSCFREDYQKLSQYDCFKKIYNDAKVTNKPAVISNQRPPTRRAGVSNGVVVSNTVKRKFVCKWPKCKFKSFSREKVAEHLQDEHLGDDYEEINCRNCDKRLLSKIKVDKALPAFQCLSCSKRFKDQSFLFNHKKICHMNTQNKKKKVGQKPSFNNGLLTKSLSTIGAKSFIKTL